MKNRFTFITRVFVLMAFLASTHTLFSQQQIDLTVRYNNTSNLYEVVGRPNFSTTSLPWVIYPGDQITVVVPSTASSGPILATPGSPFFGGWADMSTIYAPAVQPQSNFHGFGVGASFIFTNLVANQEFIFFTFTLSGGYVPGVRIFDNDCDPDSYAQGMGGGDFKNFLYAQFDLTIPFADDYYGTNYNQTSACSPCGTQILPTFNPISSYCSGANIPSLPTTSSNGITGSWSPAINNTATTTYTFTPTAGQCATSTTLTIAVNPLVTPTFNAFGPYCYGQTIPALPTTSLNGVSGTWSPAINNTATTTYTFTPSAGSCASTATTTIAPAGCQPVNNLAAASVTYNSGVVSWAPGCDETLWDVIFGTSPATTGTITYQNQISQTVSLANLSPSTTYYVHVRAECGPGVNSVWTTISFTTAPINDVICNALTIKPSSGTALNTYNAWTTNINCSNRTGNSTFATATGTPEVSCGGTNGRSLWYKFTTPSCVVGGVVPFAIEVSTDNAGTSFNTKIELFSSSDGTCNGILTPIVCNDDDESVINNCGGTSLLTSTIAQSLAPNTTYFVLLDGYNGEGGALEISGRALTDPPVVTAVSNTQFTVTTANVGAELYTYLARIVGSSGYSIGSSTNTSASFNMGNGATYETYIRYRCETNNQSQWYNTPEATITLPYSEACDPVIDLNCELSAPGSYTLTWTGLPGLYTANGTLTGYQLYYRVIGSTGYNFISNLSVTCNGTSCTRTINGLNNPIGYEFWLKTRCSPTWTVQSNTAVCALGAKGLGDDLFSFTNPQTGDEYHDVKFSDKWGDFGLDLNETGEYYIGINEKNEIYAEKISQNNSIGIEEEISFELIPNPTKNATTMVFNKSINHGTYKVIDALGRIVLEGEVSDTERVELNAAGWKNGVYHVQLTSKDKTVNRKLVVTK